MGNQFGSPVLIRIDGGVQAVSSAAEAAECLDHHWPVQASRKRQNARAICMLVMDRVLQARAARRAFEAAADEVNILLPDDE
jgi:hypothetical protein